MTHRASDSPERTPAQISAYWQTCYNCTVLAHRRAFAAQLGVDDIALDCLGAAWSPNDNAWAFPMRDAAGAIVGIRLRNASGQKWAVKSSHAGLFIPFRVPSEPIVYICEGPTDTAAALSIGLYSIGRPSCRGHESMIRDFCHFHAIKRAIIVADNDSHHAGIDGAEQLAASLGQQIGNRKSGIASRILIPPTKDLREMVRAGADHKVINALINGLRWESGVANRESGVGGA